MPRFMGEAVRRGCGKIIFSFIQISLVRIIVLTESKAFRFCLKYHNGAHLVYDKCHIVPSIASLEQ
jgi:hypothetical protein